MKRRDVILVAFQISMDEATRRHEQYLDHDFAERWNEMAVAQMAFADAYNKGLRPLKEIKAVRKAMERVLSTEMFKER